MRKHMLKFLWKNYIEATAAYVGTTWIASLNVERLVNPRKQTISLNH